MQLTARETERLLLFTAAELARRRLREGIPLSHPDVIALACDVALEAARGGESYERVKASVHGLVRREDLMPGVAELVKERHQVEVSFADGTRLVPLEGLVAE